MNNWLASNPDCFKSAMALKYFLEQFGPLTGRYHLSLPPGWQNEILEKFTKVGDLERKRAEVILQRAREKAALFSRKSGSWEDSLDWFENMRKFVQINPDLLTAIVAPDPSNNSSLVPPVVAFDDLELPPTEEETICATPEEYVRVSSILLRGRPELVFIDPYMNLADHRVRVVMQCMFEEIAIGRCEHIVIYVRHKVIADAGMQSSEIKRELNELKSRSALNASIEYILVDDQKSKDRMHGRYLLSLKGGIRFEQGFQKLSRGRKVEVAPIGQAILDDLVGKFIERKNDLRPKETIRVAR